MCLCLFYLFFYFPGWFFVFPCSVDAGVVVVIDSSFYFIPVVISSQWYHACYTCNHLASSPLPLSLSSSLCDIVVQPKTVYFFPFFVHLPEQMVNCWAAHSMNEWKKKTARGKERSQRKDTDTLHCSIHTERNRNRNRYMRITIANKRYKRNEKCLGQNQSICVCIQRKS